MIGSQQPTMTVMDVPTVSSTDFYRQPARWQAEASRSGSVHLTEQGLVRFVFASIEFHTRLVEDRAELARVKARLAQTLQRNAVAADSRAWRQHQELSAMPFDCFQTAVRHANGPASYQGRRRTACGRSALPGWFRLLRRPWRLIRLSRMLPGYEQRDSALAVPEVPPHRHVMGSISALIPR
jgi:hypothetical protein